LSTVCLAHHSLCCATASKLPSVSQLPAQGAHAEGAATRTPAVVTQSPGDESSAFDPDDDHGFAKGARTHILGSPPPDRDCPAHPTLED
jgi:hypothetical protein